MKEQQKKLITEIMNDDAKDGLYISPTKSNADMNIGIHKTNNMKLYTEEQVNTMLRRARLHNQDDTEMFTDEYLIADETPIQLPSDEEAGVIALNIASTLKDGLDSREEAFYLAGFQTCVKWMKEQILNK